MALAKFVFYFYYKLLERIPGNSSLSFKAGLILLWHELVLLVCCLIVIEEKIYNIGFLEYGWLYGGLAIFGLYGFNYELLNKGDNWKKVIKETDSKPRRYRVIMSVITLLLTLTVLIILYFTLLNPFWME